MNRRTLLKGAVGLFGSAFLPPFLRPASAGGWGAIAGVLPTHQFIVRQAILQLAEDPLFQTFQLPTAEEISAYDYVVPGVYNAVSDEFGFRLSGPGPDASGQSPYSWHYFNPSTGKGGAPGAISDFFGDMMARRVRSQDQCRSAAWLAHFLADMFVPYHTVGMPAAELNSWQRGGRWILNRELCGDWQTMHSPFEKPLPEWGLDHDYTQTVGRFLSLHPPGNAERVDWFDPWYWNGYTESFLGDMTGSHQTFELRAHKGPEFMFFEQHKARVRNESFFDPLWQNRRAPLQDDFWAGQAAGAKTYAEACAARTRQLTSQIMANPSLGIALAARGVATLYRASMTSLGLASRWEPRPEGGYRIVGTLTNRNPRAAVGSLQVRLRYEHQGQMRDSVHTLNGELTPGAVHSVSWDVLGGEAQRGYIDASGVYVGIPDLGYARVGFASPGVLDNPPEPEQPESQEPSPTNLSKGWDGDWSVEFAEASNPSNSFGPWVLRITSQGSMATVTWIDGDLTAEPPLRFLLTDLGCLELHIDHPGGGDYEDLSFCLSWDRGVFGDTFEGHQSVNGWPKVRYHGRRIVR